jgi:hypothetical protein
MTRLRMESALAGIFVSLAALTAVVPEWIELVFGLDPDGGSGRLEWALVLGFGALAAVSAMLARRDYVAAKRTM